MRILGIDCGGTKCAYLLTDEHGKIIARHEGPGGTLIGLGLDNLRAMLTQGITTLCESAGVTRDDIDYLGAGFPGYGEQPGSEEIAVRACEEAFRPGRVICECDCYIGWAGSLAMQPGINCIAGTGANCYGIDEQGNSERCNGWGAGCDEGSCRWLGQKLISLFTRQADGRMPRTALYQMFRDHFHITGHDELFIGPLNHEICVSGKEVAKLQLLLRDIYDAGDPHAKACYEAAAEEIFLSASTVARKLGLKPGYLVSYSGGLFRTGERVLAPLRTLCEANGATLYAPRYTPDQGAVLMAMRALDPNWNFDRLTFTE